MYSLIRDLLQWNVAGIPAYHQVTEWDFDPDISQKRREQYYEVNFTRFLLFAIVSHVRNLRFILSSMDFERQSTSKELDRGSTENIDNDNTKMLRGMRVGCKDSIFSRHKLNQVFFK